ncbi:hypothetical protein [Sphingobium sp. EM0848]|uniref:hypothetical protein n=1 Tax=Sphingobium sp. EM0848 TaxID=2743473 RepID=UPI00159C766E|nr:hypothetical protein [Sphingobium sp. EM0848]
MPIAMSPARSKNLLPRRARILMRRHGPEAMISRRRVAYFTDVVRADFAAQ